jgi:hypothetical protein
VSEKQYDNTNRGALFKNDRRTTDKHPEYTGTLNVNGTEYWLSAWVRDGKRGKYFSMAIKPKEERQVGQAQPENSKATTSEDDLPF